MDSTRELTILNAIARELNRSVDLDQALQTALEQVASLLGLTTSWIWLIDEKGESYLAASQNLPPALADNPESMEGNCFCLDTYRKGHLQGAANINVVKCSRLWGLVKGTNGLQYHSSIPIYARDGSEKRKIGVLNVGSTKWRKLSAEDLQILNTVADFLSIAIERARLYGQSVEHGAVEERYRLSRELHDTLGQGLAAILFRLEALDARLESGAPTDALRSAVRDTMDLTRRSLEDARRSVLDLRAATLEGRTLSDALDLLSRRTSEEESLDVTYRATGAGRPLPVRIESGLFRIAQEALANILRHAGAKSARFDLVTTPAFVRLSVEDDGTGFDPDNTPDDRFGLQGMSERAHLMDGELSIESEPGRGTRIEVIVPLTAAT